MSWLEVDWDQERPGDGAAEWLWRAIEWGSSLTLDGELARSLVIGGAYFRCWKAWSSWFHDVAWDSTLVLIDRRLQAISVLVSTDTD